ncbi:MAG: putative cofD-like protein [Myxococcota bacterium]|jgi:uncharacterized cofD-like protein
MQKSIVVIGGGTGSFSVLSGLRPYDLDVCSIVSMMDSGGNSGKLRDAYGVLPPGDLRRCLIALSDESQLLRDVFSFRFEEPPLAGHNLGNLFFLALTQATGSEKQAIESIGRMLKIRGRVVPVTWDHSHLNAELDNGDLIEGEANIDVRGNESPALPPHDPSRAIKNVYLSPPAQANCDAIEAVAKADILVMAPGDLYTSSIPNLLVNGMAEAIQNSSAPFVYVVNLMTKHGETDNYTASQHVAQIERYAGRVPDAVLVHDGSIPKDLLSAYNSEHSKPVEIDDERIHALGVGSIWRKDIMAADSLVRHDPERTGTALMKLAHALFSQT